MNILDVFKKIFSKNKKPALIASEYDFEKTQDLIQLNTLEALIYNSEIFNKFLDFENNRDVFGENATMQGYSIAIKTYVDFMKNKGIKFSREEKGRIKNIITLLPKEVATKNTNLYDNKNAKTLYSISKQILSDEDTFNKFLSSQSINDSFEGVSIDGINKYLSTEIKEFGEQIQLPSEIKQRLSFLNNKYEVTSTGYKVNPNIQINPNFEKLVMGNIKPNMSVTQFASDVYNNLNINVKYNSNFFALDQDLSDEFAKSIYEKPIDTVSEKDNNIVCKTWAELYAYFLEKNGIDAYVVGKGKHKFVKAFDGTTEITADATSITSSFEDFSHLSDLTRSKLGYKSTGFEIKKMGNRVNLNSNLNVIQRDYTYEYAAFEDSDELTELLDQIDDNRDLTALVMGENELNTTSEKIVNKLSFINSMMQKNNLDNMDSIAYLGHLFHSILTDNEKRQVALNLGLYEHAYSNECNVLPLISVRSDDSTEENPKYSFFMYNQDKRNLFSVGKGQILESVAKEQLSLSPSRDKIEGLPELALPREEWAYEYLQPSTNSRETPTESIER